MKDRFFKKGIAVFFVLIIFLSFFSPKKSVFANAPAITAYPSEALSLDTSFTVTATMSGLSKSATYRLRIAIAQSGTSNYFGSTYDGANWHMGSIADGNFLSITTDGNGAWGGNIQGKIDSDDPNFTTGGGTYDLKIGRYTQTGSTATWSDLENIIIVMPPTSIPTNTPTQSPTSTSTPAPTSRPTPTRSPTSAPTSTPTHVPTVKLTSAVLPTEKEDAEPTDSFDILGESTLAAELNLLPTETSTTGVKTLGSSENNVLSKVLIGTGSIFLIACGILVFRNYKKSKNDL